MKYENKDIQIVSSKVVESIFCNIYEVLSVKKTNFKTDITYTTSLVNDGLIELTVGFKLIDKMGDKQKEELVLALTSLTKVHVAKDKLKMISETEFELDESVTRQMVAFAMNNLTIKTRIILELYNFGNVHIPFLADSKDLELNKNESR